MLTSKESQGSAAATQGGGSGGSGGSSGGSDGGGGGGGNSGGAGNSGAADLESASLVSSLFRTSVDQSDAVSTGSFDDASLNVENLSLCESVSDYRCYVEDQPMCVWILQNGVEASKFTVRVSISGFPLDVIRAVIRKRIRLMTLAAERHDQVVEKYQYQYILKVCGQELYFISEDYPLCQYRYIRNCLANNAHPQLMMVLRKSFQEELRDCVFRVPNFMRRPKVVKHGPSSRREVLSLWSLDPSLKFKVMSPSLPGSLTPDLYPSTPA